MKCSHSTSSRPARRQDGVAVIVMLVLLSLILIYIIANVRSLNQLHRELNLTEQRQVHRLNATQPAAISLDKTNAPAVTGTNAVEIPLRP